LVTITSEGHPSVQDCLDVIETIRASPAPDTDLRILYDRRRDETAPEPAMVAWLIAYVRDHRALLLSTCRCAVVFPPVITAMRGTLEALDLIAAELRIDIRPFLRIEDARRWLQVE
jgi:hypothetical protein